MRGSEAQPKSSRSAQGCKSREECVVRMVASYFNLTREFEVLWSFKVNMIPLSAF
jgi:hypothetical protein